MKTSKHCIVSGRVQGVFFRKFTLEKALSLELKGWVRNLQNGDVECLVCGESDKVELLCQWLHQGPPAAQVTKVIIEDAPWEAFPSFTILR